MPEQLPERSVGARIETFVARTSKVGRPLALALVALFGLGACSPLCRLEIRFVLPAKAPPDPARFHFSAKKACPPAPLPVPAAGSSAADSAWHKVKAAPGALDVLAGFRGSHCAVRVTAFYDANGNGKPDAGDFAGSSPTIEVRDRGIFAGNLTTGRDVHLTLVK